MDSDSSETNLVIITNTDRFKLFCKLYWRTLVICGTPIILLPVIFIKDNDAYKNFYVFLMVIVYWVTDVLHPAVVALMPIALTSLMGVLNSSFISEMYIRNDLIDCMGVMMLIIAMEHSNIHRRIALKVLLVFGCSHYRGETLDLTDGSTSLVGPAHSCWNQRIAVSSVALLPIDMLFVRLSFLLFFLTMFLSMWISNVLACGLMMPLVKAILSELEKMGILEIYQTIGKARQKSNRHEQSLPRPTDFTVFYFLGIAYSSSIGDMATIMSSQTNQIFKIYCETIFPVGPKIEFPHFMLLNLPAVLVMETLLYTWMNFYFLGMFRNQSAIAIEIGMTEEESQYIDTLLATQFQQLGNMKFHEFAVATVVVLTALLQATISTARIDHQGSPHFHDHIRVSSPCIMCVVLLFIMPVNLDFIKLFNKHNDLLPNKQTKACLSWDLVKSEVKWSVPFILAGSSSLFESLRNSDMTVEFEEFLLIFANWPPSAFVFVIVLFSNLLTQFASNSCVVYALLPSVAKISIICDINPHYLMMAATLGSSLPFHLLTGSAVNAMVCSYVHIPPWKMISAGVGPSLMALLVIWFTVAVWSTAIWTDINIDPQWADINIFNITAY